MTTPSKSAQSKAYIYSLTDPFGEAFCYVGCSINPVARFAVHKGGKDTLNVPMSNWLKYLRETGKEPILTILDECERSEAPQAEQDAIAIIRAVRGIYCLNSARSSLYA